MIPAAVSTVIFSLVILACDSEMPRADREAIEAVCADITACIDELSARYDDEERLVCTRVQPGAVNPVLSFVDPSAAGIGEPCPGERALARAIIGSHHIVAEPPETSALLRFLVLRASAAQRDREELFRHLPMDLQTVAGGIETYTACTATQAVLDVKRVDSASPAPDLGGKMLRVDFVERHRTGGPDQIHDGLHVGVGKNAAGAWIWYEPGLSCMPAF